MVISKPDAGARGNLGRENIFSCTGLVAVVTGGASGESSLSDSESENLFLRDKA